ncbi:hypothetical protein BH11BAC4_BH11BAC4_23750 [soil metagenome]
MRNSRSNARKIIPLIILLIAFATAATWAYYQFFKEDEIVPDKDLITLYPIGYDTTNNTTAATPGRDSLKKEYAASVQRMDSRYLTAKPVSEPERKLLAVKFKEVDQLKTEISTILKNRDDNEGLAIANRKIKELQKKVDELTGKNSEVEKENKEIYSMLKRFSNERPAAGTDQKIIAIPVVYETRPATESWQVAHKTESKPLSFPPATETNRLPALATDIFETSNLQLSALTLLDNNKELETYQADHTDKFSGSFTLRNNVSRDRLGEIMVVLQGPDGSVLQKSNWESGTFETGDGKKIYSSKIVFNARRGEPNQISFSLNVNKCATGKYSMMIYLKGKLIGKLDKKLS